MTWIIITGLVCTVVILLKDHTMTIARVNALEQEVVSLRIELLHINHPAKKNRRDYELDPWLD